MVFRVFIITLLILAVEYWFYQGILTISRDLSDSKKQVVKTVYFIITGYVWSVFVLSLFYPPQQWNKFFRNYVAGLAFMIFILKVIPAALLLIEDLSRVIRYVFSSISSDSVNASGQSISRFKFISWVAVSLAAIPGIGLIYGIIKGGHRYRIHRVKIASKKIPASFDGFRIAQISDMHVGSFTDTKHLSDAFDLLMNEKPEVIFFTGDMVNNVKTETEGFVPVFQKLKAEHGVYSTLGNHDYGDYVDWPSAEAKRENLNQLKQVHAESGWKLLMNEHVHLSKGDDKITVLGIENWGAQMRFPKYGKMKEAYTGTELDTYKILLSHDPSHWEAEVTQKYTDVDLTLSGHTHGMQFGIEIPGLNIKWSPVKYLYKQWAGLYSKGDQKLYVNRGLGYLGYPGRLGIWPEITIIELSKS